MGTTTRCRLTDRELLEDRRALFVGDRVAWTQSAALMMTGVVASLVERIGISEAFPVFGLVGCATLLVCGVVPLAIPHVRERFYYEFPWFFVSAPMVLIWISVTVYVGVTIDLWVGAYNVFLVSVATILMYLSGYYVARWLRVLRRRMTDRERWVLIIGLASVIIAGAIVAGLAVFDAGLEACKIAPDDWTFSEAKGCPLAMSGIYIIVIGVGMWVSVGLQYLMLHNLYDPDGLDVNENGPNELIFKMLIWNMALTFVAWVMLLILLPPLAGGGGGGKKSGSSSKSSSRSSSKARSKRSKTAAKVAMGSAMGAMAAYALLSTEDLWGRVGLEKPREPEQKHKQPLKKRKRL